MTFIWPCIDLEYVGIDQGENRVKSVLTKLISHSRKYISASYIFAVQDKKPKGHPRPREHIRDLSKWKLNFFEISSSKRFNYDKWRTWLHPIRKFRLLRWKREFLTGNWNCTFSALSKHEYVNWRRGALPVRPEMKSYLSFLFEGIFILLIELFFLGLRRRSE